MSRDDFYASPLGAAYSAYMERPRLSRRIGRCFWGGDTRPYYESMARGRRGRRRRHDRRLPLRRRPGAARPRARAATSATSPPTSRRRCWGGRATGPGSAASPSASSSSRPTRRRLPLEDSSADLFLSYWGLHCFPDPAAAIAEAARVLKPGGRLVGATFVRGPSLRQRLTAAPQRRRLRADVHRSGTARAGSPRPGCALTGSGRSGLYMFFEARLPRPRPQSPSSATSRRSPRSSSASARGGGRGARPSGRSRGRRAGPRARGRSARRLHLVPDACWRAAPRGRGAARGGPRGRRRSRRCSGAGSARSRPRPCPATRRELLERRHEVGVDLERAREVLATSQKSASGSGSKVRTTTRSRATRAISATPASRSRQWWTVIIAIAASKLSSSKGRSSALAWTTGAAPGGRWAIITRRGLDRGDLAGRRARRSRSRRRR